MPLTAPDAVQAAALFHAAGGRRGRPGGRLLAAVAPRAGAAVATENRADFVPFAAATLQVEG